MVFAVDSRIKETSQWLCDLSLSSVFIKNDANFLWFLLVPRVENAEEIFHLSRLEQQQLMDEIALLSRTIHDFSKPDKINIGALGNIVSQLHVHIIARFKNDLAWPHSIWQPAISSRPYNVELFKGLIDFWRNRFTTSV